MGAWKPARVGLRLPEVFWGRPEVSCCQTGLVRWPSALWLLQTLDHALRPLLVGATLFAPTTIEFHDQVIQVHFLSFGDLEIIVIDETLVSVPSHQIFQELLAFCCPILFVDIYTNKTHIMPCILMVFISTIYGIKTIKSKGWYLYFSFLVELKLAHLVHRILVFIAGLITHEIRALHIPVEELTMLGP